MLSEPFPVSAAEAGSRTVVMTTSQPQLLATGGIVAATTVVGSTVPVPASIATVQVAAAQALSLHAPIAGGHRSGGGIIHTQPLTAQVCGVHFVGFIKMF